MGSENKNETKSLTLLFHSQERKISTNHPKRANLGNRTVRSLSRHHYRPKPNLVATPTQQTLLFLNYRFRHLHFTSNHVKSPTELLIYKLLLRPSIRTYRIQPSGFTEVSNINRIPTAFPIQNTLSYNQSSVLRF